ncbi:hypothetical protein AAFP32_11075 [Brevibacterium sp. CBA3109]|uniref:Uncharacterized protein n=1 Tax=Brevibacterium koreense TaxID=3140787 RepID=A0AAU7UI63_9MICO
MSMRPDDRVSWCRLLDVRARRPVQAEGTTGREAAHHPFLTVFFAAGIIGALLSATIVGRLFFGGEMVVGLVRDGRRRKSHLRKHSSWTFGTPARSGL